MGLQEKEGQIPNSEFTSKTILYLVVFQMQSNPKFWAIVSTQKPGISLCCTILDTLYIEPNLIFSLISHPSPHISSMFYTYSNTCLWKITWMLPLLHYLAYTAPLMEYSFPSSSVWQNHGQFSNLLQAFSSKIYCYFLLMDIIFLVTFCLMKTYIWKSAQIKS